MSNIYGKRQKNRSFVKFKYPTFRFGNISIFALGSGFLNFRMVSNFFIKFRKIFRFNKSITKFWYNLYCNYIITKKALNVRMGKGKGSKKGRVCHVKSSAPIIELNYCRLGILLYLYKYVKVRCSFPVFYFYKRIQKFSSPRQLIKYHLINNRNKFKKIKKKYIIRKRILETIKVYKSTRKAIRGKRFSILIRSYFLKFIYKRYRKKFKIMRPMKNYLFYTKRYRMFRHFLRKKFWIPGGHFFFAKKMHYNRLFKLEQKYSKFFIVKFSKIKARGKMKAITNIKKKKLFVKSWVDIFVKNKIKVPTSLLKVWGFSDKEIKYHKKINKVRKLVYTILRKKKNKKKKNNLNS